MLTEISYYLIFGKPLIMYLGITVLALFLIVGIMGALLFKGNTKISVMAHRRLAMLAIIAAIIHGSLGVLAYF